MRRPGQAQSEPEIPTLVVPLQVLQNPEHERAEAEKATARSREKARRAAVLKVAGIAMDDLVDRGIACNGCGSSLKAGKCPFCSPDARWGKS